MIADLHCHSTASDGEYAPEAVYALACDAGVELLALTDHDTVAGVLALRARPEVLSSSACRLVAGVEISTVWNKRSVHVVGLNIDVDATVMLTALEGQRQVRYDRARRIGEKLARQGYPGGYEGAIALAGESAPCRPHFAAWLVAQGACKDGKQAFDRYLGNNKMAGINHAWPGIEEAVGWIVAAGGVAVLAHPEDYRLTRTKMRSLLSDFCAAGGRGMELAAPGKPEALVASMAALCREFELGASVGSDYHGGSQGWRRLGKTRAIPADLPPVWDLF